MIHRLNEVHYAGETGFYTTASLRPVEESLLAGAPRGGRILDVGCGVGRVTLPAAARGVAIVGVDVNHAALRAARGGCPGASLTRASMTALPFAGGVFAQVWCLRFSFNALPTVAERTATLRELWRVCAPGGQILVEVFNWYHRGRFGLLRAANLLEVVARRLHRAGGGRSVPLPDRDILYLANKARGAAPGFAHLTTVRELQQLAAACGFADAATITSERGLLDGTRAPVRARHGGYGMWLVLTRAGGPG